MRYILGATAFIEGAVVMILELVGSRIVAPYLGTSIIIWTSLIGVILASLSFGYYQGGKMADRHPSLQRLTVLILIASICIGLIVLLKPLLVLLNPASLGGLMMSALILTTLLFAPPTIALGMVTPYIAKLLIKNTETSGSTVGSLYALSTLGSIVGTFLGGFFLISYFGSTNILIVLAIILFAIGIFLQLASSSWNKTATIAAGLFLIISFGNLDGQIFQNPFKILVADIDTRYSRILIYDTTDMETGENVRHMTDNIHSIQSGMFLKDPDALLFEYTKFFDLAGHFRPDFKKSLMIGAGMYSYPKHFIKAFPNSTMDIAEIDPDLQTIAEKYFSFSPSPALKIFSEDGRTYLNRTNETYDVIFLDAFRSEFTIPYQLTTRESVEQMHNKLTPDGIVIVNLISAVKGFRGEILQAILATYKEEFADVRVYKVEDYQDTSVQNVILIAFKNKETAMKETDNAYFQSFLDREILILPEENTPILTDDFSPVERLMAKMLL